MTQPPGRARHGGPPFPDAGQAGGGDPPFPNHSSTHDAGKFRLARHASPIQLPPTGAVVSAAPPELEGNSGSPLRALALAEG